MRFLQRRMATHLVDIGANITDAVFSGVYNGSVRHEPDLDQVLSRARDAGVTRIIVTAGTLEQSREALELAKTCPMLSSTVGVHPTRCNEFKDLDKHLEQLSTIIREGAGKVVAVGECGLDYDRTQFCDVDVQKRGYEAQFALAEKFRLPMFLHNRNTGGDFVAMTRENRNRFTTGVVHSFTGSMEEMQQILDLDLYIGINGCSMKTEENLAVAAAVPLDRILLETDCPYCEIRTTHAGFSHVKSKWPSKDKKKYEKGCCVKGRLEPCHIRQVLEVLAAARGIPEVELGSAAFNNTMKVFFNSEVANMGSSPHEWSVSAAK